ncbi:MAG: glycosyltransferase family 2 protein [Spirochaetales bacterium]|nr:glycosyltransferase family 2 protein [Spirochaetales bacterium]
MKLIIQIPCFNEENTLPITLKDLPREVDGFDVVEWCVIDDGSTDKTVEVARSLGVDHIISFKYNNGLARAFMKGIEVCLKAKADVIVNTDADNQYYAGDIPKLVLPVLNGEADMVIGERPIKKIKHFSPFKKILQRIGSFVVKTLSNTDVPDAPSGFRAISRYAAMHLNIFSKYTYTMESIIQAGRKNLKIVSVKIRTNDVTRKSKLVKSTLSYIFKSMVTIIRIFVVYNPFRFFMILSILLFIGGIIPGIRYLILFIYRSESGHIQSLILSAILLIMSVQIGVLAFIGDLNAVNRSIMEDVQYMLRKKNYKDYDSGEDTAKR